MGQKQFALRLTLLAVFAASPARGTDYYVSPAGSDSNPGTSRGEAWRTIDAVNESTFSPGDRILFEGGQTFAGSISLRPPSCGDGAKNPIVLSSYGTGPGLIDAGQATAVEVRNCGGYEVSGLHLVGSGRETNTGYGVRFVNDLEGDVKLAYLRIDDLEVSGFREGGIRVVGTEGRSGYREVQIRDNRVHDNGDNGISVGGVFWYDPAYAHADLLIAGNRVYDNPGKPGRDNGHTGSGIVVSNADGVWIERNIAYNNGADNVFGGGGPVGIWAWDSNAVVIQFNESHHNRSSTIDGGGFDLDGGCTNSIMQYNYSHDNNGAGYLVAEFFGARPMVDNIIRYNISENDGRRSSYSGIVLWNGGGVFRGLDIYNNTIFVDTAPSGTPAAFSTISGGLEDVRVVNNIFVTGGEAVLIKKSNRADILFQGNSYFDFDGDFEIRDTGVTYSDLASWRTATGQEMLGGTAVGSDIDPALTDPGQGGTIDDPTQLGTLRAYQLRAGSPMIDSGLVIAQLVEAPPGIRDFYGNPIPDEVSYDIGAHERPPENPGTPTPTRPPSDCPGDCDSDNAVSVGELIRAVRIALGLDSIEFCTPVDVNANRVVTIDELLLAVGTALGGCT